MFATVSTDIPSYNAIHGYMPLHTVSILMFSKVKLDLAVNQGEMKLDDYTDHQVVTGSIIYSALATWPIGS